MKGQTLSHYTLLEKLGEGGMGVVYKARDVRLDRLVAIKLLLPEKVADPERKRRFVQEARAASALNHPNIVAIYDVGSVDGKDFIVMEFVDGVTIDRTLARRRLSVREVVDYAIQIADALTRAHAAGIVHRDLKPGNVIVNSEGLLKVLDFGLAKLLDHSQVSQSSQDDVTLVIAPMTDHGTMLGTTPYMSPEQAEGKSVDARSDIFSFGSLVYEMISGQPAFQGESKIAVLTAILEKEPPPLRGIPSDLGKIVARCLRKDVSWRFQHMDDAKVALAELKREAESGALSQPGTTVPASAARRRRGVFWLAAGLAVTVLAAAGFAWWRSSQPAAALPALFRLTSDAGLNTDPTISQDGKLVAFASDRSGAGNFDIWIQDTVAGSSARLTTGPADDHEPDFSPDGTRIAFRSERQGGGIYTIPTLGGEPRLLAPGGREPRFSPDGKWIAYWTGQDFNFGSRIYIVPSGGGVARQLQPQFPLVRSVIWAPDGKHLLFYAFNKDLWDWYVTSLDGHSVVATGALPLLNTYRMERFLAATTMIMPGLWDARGDVIFSASTGDSTGLWRLPVSLASGRIEGIPERITLSSAEDVGPSLSANGKLAFSSQTFTTHVWMLPADTNAARITGPMRQLTSSKTVEYYPHASDDGEKVVWVTSGGRNVELWIKDLRTGDVSLLAGSTAEQGAPKLSRDGTRAVYQVLEDGKLALYTIPTAGGVPERVCSSCGRPTHWSKDGKWILFDSFTSEPASAGVLELSSGRASLLLRNKTSLYSLRFSPDDRWIAFHVLSSPATRTIYVAPFHGGAEIPASDWIAVTDGKSTDREPYWSPDGHLLYYLSERDGFRCVWAQRLEPVTRRPVGQPLAVYHFHSARRSLARVSSATGLVGLSIAGNKIVFAQGEAVGNIWMMDVPARSQLTGLSRFRSLAPTRVPRAAQ